MRPGATDAEIETSVRNLYGARWRIAELEDGRGWLALRRGGAFESVHSSRRFSVSDFTIAGLWAKLAVQSSVWGDDGGSSPEHPGRPAPVRIHSGGDIPGRPGFGP